MATMSLDQKDKLYWNPAPCIIDLPAEEVALSPSDGIRDESGLPCYSLNGQWELAHGGEHIPRLCNPWDDAIPAPVPGTVHTALFEAGVIPDPMTEINDKIARQYSYKEWWYKKTFPRPKGVKNARLVFDGVCYQATFWLNGVYLGKHAGMFGGPVFDIEEYLQEENTLIVFIDNAPAEPHEYSEYGDFDTGWNRGVVINCVYGWHYACLPTRGIWAGVRIESGPAVQAERPFFATADLEKGLVDFALKLHSPDARRCEITLCVTPKNFEGNTYELTVDRCLTEGENIVRLRFAVPDHKLWWPNGHGDPNLYTMQVVVKPEQEDAQVFCENFGFRTIEMAPLPCGEREDLYNWTFVVNGRKMFIKGVNWCTTDALLRLPEERYQRFLTLAKNQHVQLLRSWGGGIMETDTFYNLCDELGLMVMQEWPVCWDSERYQPMDELLETVAYTVPRLRNHPSLILWCGGNESGPAQSVTLDKMSRLTLELDSTRPYHRTEPHAGSTHNYDSYWGLMDLDVTLRLEAPFLGEFGFASSPNLESVQRYLAEDEKDLWPVPQYCSFTHHTPIFNEKSRITAYRDMYYLSNHVEEFCPADTMASWIMGTQLVQATGIRHTLERNRTNWPNATGICYYKFTDVYPACSWATVDYYGVPKLAYDVLADSYAPLGAYAIFDSTTADGLCAPVYLVDEAGALDGKSWTVRMIAYDEQLNVIKCCEASGSDHVDTVQPLGFFSLTTEQTAHTPLLITSEVICEGKTAFRTFYWLNYREKTGCLFTLPKTALSYTYDDGCVTVRNDGSLPAIGITLACPSADTAFYAGDNLFCLHPGETQAVSVSHQDGLVIQAWNADGAAVASAVAPAAFTPPAGEAFCSEKTEWTPTPMLIGQWDATETFGYESYDAAHHHALIAMHGVERQESPRGGNLLRFSGGSIGLIKRDVQNLNGGFCYEFGLTVDELGREQVLLAHGTGEPGSYRFFVNADGNLCFSSAELGEVVSSLTVKATAFHQIALIHDGETVTFAVDGDSDSHPLPGIIPSVISDFAFGAIPAFQLSPETRLKGTLEKIRMYNYPKR